MDHVLWAGSGRVHPGLQGSPSAKLHCLSCWPAWLRLLVSPAAWWEQVPILLGGGGYQIISTGTFVDRSNEVPRKLQGGRQQKQTREADAAATPGSLKNSPAGSAELVENLSNGPSGDSAARQQMNSRTR